MSYTSGGYISEDSTLRRIDTPNGYISEGATRYYISDHQGNVRQVVDSVGTVLQDNHYYPFGMLMGESSDILEANRTLSALSGNPYRYSGNRLITHANAHLGDFNARWYDFQTLRFLQPDPFREKYYPLPPYLYCAANPIMLTDKTGAIFKLFGNDEDVSAALALYEKSMGDNVSMYVDENGCVQMNENEGFDTNALSESEVLCYNSMRGMIDSEDVTEINVVSNSTDVIIGDVKTATIDIADITALGDDTAVNSIGALWHETEEQRVLQSGALDYIENFDTRTTKAHIKASHRENRVTGYSIDHDRLIDDIRPKFLKLSSIRVKWQKDATDSFKYTYLFFKKNNFIFRIN